MRGKGIYYLLALLLLISIEGKTQTIKTNILPEGYQKAQIQNGDTIAVVNLREVFIYPQLRFKNKRQQARYTKLVRDVKRTLPLARMIRGLLIETYEEMMKLPENKRDDYIKQREKDLKKRYTPMMKKLTYAQGRLLIKLVDRECNQTSYDIVKAFFGPFKAGFYQTFASLFGASLKKEYDPEDNDALTERVILMVESGQL